MVSGYESKLKPSIDRIDEYTHYTIGNIQLMTWGENKAKQATQILNAESNSGERCKPVLQLTKDMKVVEKFISASDAARRTSLNQSHISGVCRGDRHTHGGYKWRYIA